MQSLKKIVVDCLNGNFFFVLSFHITNPSFVLFPNLVQVWLQPFQWRMCILAVWSFVWMFFVYTFKITMYNLEKFSGVISVPFVPVVVELEAPLKLVLIFFIVFVYRQVCFRVGTHEEVLWLYTASKFWHSFWCFCNL